MFIENENSFKAALGHSFNLFVGSGFSVLAKDKDESALPSGPELAVELTKEFGVPNDSQLDLPKICTIVEFSKKRELRDYLTRRFSVSTFDSRYHVLDKLRIKNIFTTNIDNLVYKIYAASESNYINDVDSKGPAYMERHAINLITLHGSVLDDSRPFRFGVADLASAFGSDPDKWYFLTQRLQEHPTLFWGYSVSDAGTLQALNPETIKGRRHNDKWIVVHPSAINNGTLDYFHALGFQIIEADTSELLDYLEGAAETIKAPKSPPPGSKTRELFPHESIPELGTVIVRPIVHFYLGAAPQWSDIFSGQIHRTAHFGQVLNSINSGKHTIIIGGPASGKTTLLMQAASDTMFDGHKLISNSLSIAQAHFILNVLKGSDAIIFVDNFSDSLEAFDYLSVQPNLCLVGADRDYNFEIVSHRISQENYSILDVTEISDADRQSCLEQIPGGIKKYRYEKGPRRDGSRDSRMPQSLFEIIEHNISEATLKSRFASVIKQLNAEDPQLRDLLVMISYVSECRSPTSMDMLFAYLRDITGDYEEIIDMRERLGSIISDAGVTLELGDDQDYFVPRSSLVGEAVMSHASSEMLKETLLRFHTNVTPYRICSYDVFRRHAYDNRIFAKAFPSAEEGKAFYQKLYDRDGSPYMLQHAALYLSNKKRYTEAFEMIDQAINVSGGHIWSIRNSHAIILFKANIEHFDQPGARDTLRQSLKILTECYRWDKRKPYHATTFAEESIQYWDVYYDGDAHDYLDTARHWLEDEADKSPWNRRVRNLLPKVRERLGVQR
jgi:hypothetical protein